MEYLKYMFLKNKAKTVLITAMVTMIISMSAIFTRSKEELAVSDEGISVGLFVFIATFVLAVYGVFFWQGYRMFKEAQKNKSK